MEHPDTASNAANQRIDVSIIIVHYAAPDDLARCLESCLRWLNLGRVEIILVDNATPGIGWESAIPRDESAIRLIRAATNAGFGGGNNLGAREARGEFLFFLNPDVILTEDPVGPLVDFLRATPRAGAVGPRLLHLDGRLQPSRGTFPHLMLTTMQLFRIKRFLPADERLIPLVGRFLGRSFAQWGAIEGIQAVDYMTGAALMLRKDVFEAIGGFDESFFLYFEEIDLCKRLVDRGLTNYFIPGTTILHRVNSAAEPVPGWKELASIRSLQRYYHKHKSPRDRTILRAILRVWLLQRRIGISVKRWLGRETDAGRSRSHLDELRGAIVPRG